MSTATTHEIKPFETTPSEAKVRAVQTKIYNWAELHRGDCQQDGGQILFHSDGTGTFHCTTLTYHTHSGDVWHASFTVKGHNGATLFTTQTFNSPRMNDGNPPPHYTWAAQFAYNPDWFEGIASVSQSCSC